MAPQAKVSVTHEPSGEIRMALKSEPRKTYKPTPTRYNEYGMPEAAPLVYSRKLGEKVRTPSGFGALPSATTFGRAGRRMVKNCCGSLERRYGRKTLFGTVTLAGSTPQAIAMLAAWSGKCVELLRKWLTYHAPGCAFVYVWEWQKRGALHLHLAIGSDEVEHLRWLRANFQDYVHRLHETLSRLSGTDLFERNDGGSWRGFPHILRSRLEDVWKSVKRYMAKYLSKGPGKSGEFFPSRWWGCTKNLRALVNSYRECRVVEFESLDVAVEAMEHHIRCLTAGGVTVFSWCAMYAPHNKTVAAYPTDAECDDVYEAAVFLLQNWTEPSPPWRSPLQRLMAR